MTRILWNQPGENVVETGVDRGVLYLEEGARAWNGLISVEQVFTTESSEPLYFDGVKYFDLSLLGDYEATVKAVTYPDEFIGYEGYSASPVVSGSSYLDDQQPRLFGMSYRSQVGNDLEGLSHGYQLHLLYNLTAIPQPYTHSSESEASNLNPFVWDVAGLPEGVPGYKATAHAILDSRFLPSYLLEYVEEQLYGTESTDGTLMPLAELVELVAEWTLITITNNGDGTWTANGPDELITINPDGTFEIEEASAIYIDGVTYEISSG